MTTDADATDSWLDWEMDLEVLEALVADESGRRFLQNTGVTLADRMAAVQRAAGDSMSPRGVGLLQLLAEQRDIDLVGEIRVRVRRASDEA
ncbi:MAG: F0F1 ATP synthase subunit delta, partial [Pirellulaceae bacterium]|nr:F0F1 ATP synthase subunit delta [Pirellulaceae bacterium]